MKKGTTWNWDERQQKLMIEVKRVLKEGKAKRTIEIRETHNKESALKTRMNMFQQLQAHEKQKLHREKFIKEAERIKALNARMKKLPSFQEIKDVLDALRWDENRQMQQQYMQAKQDEETHKRIKTDFESLDKIVPTGKRK